MAGTAGLIDRTSAALVLIDAQERLADVMPHRDAVVNTMALLARAARVLGMPMVVTRQYPRGLGDTVPEIVEAVGPHEPVDKVAFDCAREPAFSHGLEALGRTQVIIAGMEAHICVTQTALSLGAGGYDVHVVADAVCSRRDADRDVALDRLRAAGVTVTTSESVIYEALGEAGTAEFRALLEIVKAGAPG
ncbi:MAG: hydrolase [Coriobacteriia bacterium]|nr:hydrolase [Coriobacteriia bacterium]